MTEPARSLLSRLRGAIGSLGHRTTTTAFRLGRDKADGDSHARRHRVAETSTPPSRDDIEWLANGTLATIPLALRRHLERVLIRVEEFPDEETCARLGLRSPYHLLGLYRGVPRTRRSATYPPPYPDIISLYRGPILHYSSMTDQDLADVVRHVLVHEIGHHFGFSDNDMKRIETAG
jgi:predicted Zn-dependent protease with MMP-like domain